MKKLYRKGTVHPSPPLVTDHLSYLPAAIMTLAVALSPQDREVLAYLISCSSSSSSPSTNYQHHRKGRRTTTFTSSHNSNSSNNDSIFNCSTAATGSQSARRSSTDDHPASFSCYCFRCYMSYWVRWDSSPNRQLIHEILDAFEDGPVQKKSRKEKRRKNKGYSVKSSEEGGGIMGMKNGSELVLTDSTPDKEFEELDREVDGGESGGAMVEDEDEEEEVGKGTSVGRFVGFLGEKIWGIWN